MTSEQPVIRMGDEERTYIALRVVALAVGIALYALGYLPVRLPSQRGLSLWALILIGVGTVIVLAAALEGRRPVSRMMLWVLPLDLVGVGVYTWIVSPQDALFGLCILLVVLYSMIVSRPAAIFVACAMAAAYLGGHLIAAVETPVGFTLVGLESLTIGLVGVVASNSIERQRERENEVAAAIEEREQVNEQLARRVGELQAVAEITEIIHSSLDFDEVGTLVLEIIAKAVGFSSLAIFVLDKEKSETLFSAGVGIVRRAGMRDDDALGLGEVEDHLTCQRVFDHGSTMVLFCGAAEDIDNLSDEDKLVVYALASELAVAVENSRLYKLTRRLAVTDELTGLSNYRHLQQRLDDEILRAKRFGKSLSLLMLDADDFKSYNDSYGHVAGDEALAEFAGVLRSALREVDLPARYGGEEFAVILPETDAPGAFVVAEKIRESFANHAFPGGEGGRSCTLTVSIGVATYPTYASDQDSLLREADDALYRAKTGGKNRVCTPRRPSEPDTKSGE